ncbi:hypothetical protein OXPF_04030 [Oxobacter pfennigii]|uniref:Lipoprotein n=1 Tax=Oxobacter pfennigii TaxID=36849 RepID=A0A0P8WBD6_9CLOT|nr:hypothetical protein [Oxobacter pfennigii]KPU45935.1 hypothetical protein OXPF_04030 [Oxobacter pfennigii]
MKRNIFVAFVIFTVLFIISGCTEEIVSIDMEYIKVEESSSIIKNWTEGFQDNPGVYLGKISKSDQVEEYYLLVNNQKITGETIKPHGNSGLEIIAHESENASTKISIIKITTKNKLAQYIILNGKKYDNSTIQKIDNNS